MMIMTTSEQGVLLEQQSAENLQNRQSNPCNIPLPRKLEQISSTNTGKPPILDCHLCEHGILKHNMHLVKHYAQTDTNNTHAEAICTKAIDY